jgi:MOSC domain-containing protein YiiM
MTTIRLKALMTGSLLPLGAKGVASGIVKHQVTSSLKLGVSGFEGDAQGDLIRHGGPEKAVHHYPFEHYAAWSNDIGPGSLLDKPGAFGENLSTLGLTEGSIAIGDVFELGTATVEVSQGRQPCWKLNERFGLRSMARAVQTTGRTGWYYRVLSPGIVGPEDGLRLVARRSPEWTIARVWYTFYVDTMNHSELACLSQLPALAEGWRNHALQRLETQKVEDWTRRLTGDDVERPNEPSHKT